MDHTLETHDRINLTNKKVKGTKKNLKQKKSQRLGDTNLSAYRDKVTDTKI